MKYFRVSLFAVYNLYFTTQKMKFSIKESLMENFIFCASYLLPENQDNAKHNLRKGSDKDETATNCFKNNLHDTF